MPVLTCRCETTVRKTNSSCSQFLRMATFRTLKFTPRSQYQFIDSGHILTFSSQYSHAAPVPFVRASCFLNCFSVNTVKSSFVPVYLWKFCQLPPSTAPFELVQVLNQCLIFITKWHVRLLIFCHCLNKLFYTICLLLFIDTGSISKELWNFRS